VQVELSRRDGQVTLAVGDDGAGIDTAAREGTGLSIVRALVRDELRGTLAVRGEGGTWAEVTFPA
jgi:two-component sensor histidine kinase